MSLLRLVLEANAGNGGGVALTWSSTSGPVKTEHALRGDTGRKMFNR